MSLCLACGFCCDGTLFDRVPLVEDELPLLSSVLQVAPGAHHARQPCPALEGRSCRVYAERPLTCRRFRCLLLEAHEADEVSLAGAVEVVASTRALRAKVAEALGVPDAGTVVEAARAPGVSQAAADAVARLDRQLAFHFLGQRSRRAR
ncbi:MAG: YkgJ family cysteine cluster protein [Myxococcaceae bacterium]|nr:YkgJ family cysteine cluster protein [Myxococcaceae bacterium]